MKRALFALVAVVFFGWTGGVFGQDDSYELGWQGETEVPAGTTGQTYISTLSHTGPGPGSQGWSLSIAARECTITDITFAGTDAETAFMGGFSQGGPGASDGTDDGAVIAVVLCFGCPSVVPAEATINAITVDFPDSAGTSTLLYKDQLQGIGQPVDNIITQEGQSFVPAVSEIEIMRTTGPEETFVLGWDGPSEVAAGATGETYISTLVHENPAGPGSQGWSLSIAGRNCTITDITFGGTDGETQFAGGFSQGGPGATDGVDDGAVIAVVLCFGCPNVVPTQATINAVTVDFPNDPGGTSTVLYKDGLQGIGQPVDNIITQEGNSFVPEVSEQTVTLLEGAPAFTLGWTGADEVSGGSSGDYISTLSHDTAADPGPGSQGWSLSIAARGCTISDITFGGTDGETQFAGGFSQGGPDATDGTDTGAVIAVVLCFGCPNVVPAEATINAITVDFPQVQEDTPFSLVYKDGLEGAGQPVDNIITQEGQSFVPVMPEFSGTVKAVAPLEPFIRGNANDDGRVNIADPIWIISELFRGGMESPCQDAADANDNGMVELADAILLIDYLFDGGPHPSAPFSANPLSTRLVAADCDTDPDGDSDGLGCAGSSFCSP